MAQIDNEISIPPISPDRPRDLQVRYDAQADTLIASFHGPPEAGMNVPLPDETIDLRVTLEEDALIGLEIDSFTQSFLPRHPEFLDLAAIAGVPPEELLRIKTKLTAYSRQCSAVDALLRQFAGVSLAG